MTPSKSRLQHSRLHHNTSTAAASYSVTEAACSFADLSGMELTLITQTRGFIQSNGSGFGIGKAAQWAALALPPWTLRFVVDRG